MLIAQSLEVMMTASLLITAAMGSVAATPASAALPAGENADRSAPKPDQRIAQIVTIRPKSGQEAVLAERIQALATPTRQERGTLRYELFEREDGAWLVFEFWADESALAAHLAAPYSAAFLKDMSQFVEGNPEIVIFRSVNLGH